MSYNVYIAGPMRGLAQFNFPAFNAAEDLLRHLGYSPINPARIDREEFGLDTAGMTGTKIWIPSGLTSGLPYSEISCSYRMPSTVSCSYQDGLGRSAASGRWTLPWT